MDYAHLGLKKIICIPTPGQTEQEYLGVYLSERNRIVHATQKELDLVKAWPKLEEVKGFEVNSTFGQYEQVLEGFVRSLD
ncbi:MAG: hypothetical protein AAFR59_06380 [Bacteroidota bacterium]